MVLKDDHYTYRVTWSDEGSEYVGLCAEFPSLGWLARMPESALKGIRSIVAGLFKDIQEREGNIEIRAIQWAAIGHGSDLFQIR